MDTEFLSTLAGNFRYYRRDEKLPTPVFAANFGADVSEGQTLGLIIDGARLASPRLVYHILKTSRISTNTIISTPGYHIGDQLQQRAVNNGYNEKVKEQLLASVHWPNDGYQLFDISVLSGSCAAGYLRPVCESNCVCVPRHLWFEEGGLDIRFTETGGRLANLDFYKRICECKETELYILAGEGTFHQYHGGVTTGGSVGTARENVMQGHFDQYKSIRSECYNPPQVRGSLFGDITIPAMRFLEHSVNQALKKK